MRNEKFHFPFSLFHFPFSIFHFPFSIFPARSDLVSLGTCSVRYELRSIHMQSRSSALRHKCLRDSPPAPICVDFVHAFLMRGMSFAPADTIDRREATQYLLLFTFYLLPRAAIRCTLFPNP